MSTTLTPTPAPAAEPEAPPAAPPEEPKTDSTEVEVEKDAEGDGEEFSESEAEEAKRLYQALRNPQTAGPLVAALAQRAGLQLAQNPSQAETRAEARSIRSLVKDSLGKEYEFLADRFGSALEKALELHAEAQNARLAEFSQTLLASDIDRAYDKLARETKGESRRLERRMAELADEMPIGKQNVEQYIKRLFTVASGEKSASAARQTADKIQRNATDASARTRGTAAEPQSTRTPDTKLSLTESIQFALDQQMRK